MQPGYELIKEQLFFRKELIERVDWFIRLRWLFVAAGVAGNGTLLVIDPRAPVAGMNLRMSPRTGRDWRRACRHRRYGSTRFTAPTCT